MNKEAKVYLNKFNSVKSSEYGFGIYVKDIDALYEELKANANQDGSIRMYVSKKQTPDKYGNDGTVTLNTWKPTPQSDNQKVYTPAPQALAAVGTESNDDLPF